MSIRLALPDLSGAWDWLATAPQAVVLSICLSATGATAAWTWLVADEVHTQATAAAVTAEQIKAANAYSVDLRDDIRRLEAKIDRLIEVARDRRNRENAR